MTDNPLYDALVSIYDAIKSIDWATAQDFLTNAHIKYYHWWMALYKEDPHHVIVETSLVFFVIWLVFIRRTVDPEKSSKKKNLSNKEMDWLIETWEPEPLVPILNSRQEKILEDIKTVDAIDGLYLKISGMEKPVLNLSSHDFLGLGQIQQLKDISRSTMEKYGCGSCGPRGFYGTIDQHLFFEQALQTFMGTEEAISYSDSASTISSCIPAFAKRGDLILVDEACSEPIQTGLTLSRSSVQSFKHNDMADLRAILEAIAQDDATLRRDVTQQRRFIVVEGIYKNTGDLCPLPTLMALKEEFCYRLILDETISFGTLGATGRGITEHFGVDIKEVEIITVAMDTSLASVGGACIGSREIVDHQRLSGAGYCYSASGPPFLSAAATTSLSLMQSDPSLLTKLHTNCNTLFEGIKKIPGITAASPSPLMIITLDRSVDDADSKDFEKQWEDEEDLINKLSNTCLTNGIGIVPNRFQSCWSPWGKKSIFNQSSDPMPASVRPSLRLCVSAALNSHQIESILATLGNAVKLIQNNKDGILSSYSNSSIINGH